METEEATKLQEQLGMIKQADAEARYAHAMQYAEVKNKDWVSTVTGGSCAE